MARTQQTLSQQRYSVLTFDHAELLSLTAEPLEDVAPWEGELCRQQTQASLGEAGSTPAPGRTLVSSSKETMLRYCVLGNKVVQSLVPLPYGSWEENQLTCVNFTICNRPMLLAKLGFQKCENMAKGQNHILFSLEDFLERAAWRPVSFWQFYFKN